MLRDRQRGLGEAKTARVGEDAGGFDSGIANPAISVDWWMQMLSIGRCQECQTGYPMPEAFICDYIRTPIGRFAGALSSVRTDDLAAVPIRSLVERNRAADWQAVDDLIFGCANQAGEDNRNVSRMAALLAGLPEATPAVTVNRLCGSGMDAVIMAARAIRAGEAGLVIAGGVESMSRAPMVMPKAEAALSRKAEL